MKVDPNVLKQLGQTYGVGQLQQVPDVVKVINAKASVPADEFSGILQDNGWQFDLKTNSYKKGDERFYWFMPQQIGIWTWKNLLFRIFKGESVKEAVTKWIAGDYKYPEGKGNKFKEVYAQMVGEKPEQSAPVDRMTPMGDEPEMDMPKGPVPSRDDVGNPPSEADAIIQQIQRKAKVDPKAKLSKQAPIRLPSDDIIDLYQKAKGLQNSDPEGAKKLMAFIKTLLPLEEGFIEKSQLEALISEIVKGIAQEVKKKKKQNGGNDDLEADFEAEKSLWGPVSQQDKDAAEDDADFHARVRQKQGPPPSHSKDAFSRWDDWGSSKSNRNPDEEWVINMANKIWKNPQDIGKGSLKWRLDKAKQAKSGEMVYQLSKDIHFTDTRFIINRDGKWYYLDIQKPGHEKKWKELPESPPVKEMTMTAAVSPVSTPKAFKPKTEEEALNEMNTTNGGTTGYNVPGAFSRKGGSKAGLAGSAALGYTLTPIGKKDMELKADKLH